MDTEDKSKKNLSDELESIREQIARLQGLVQQETFPEEDRLPTRKQDSSKPDKRLFELLIHSSPDGILAFDRNLTFTIWNPGMENIFGIGAESTLGKHVFEACPFLRELGEDVNFQAAIKGEKIVSRNRRYTIPGTTSPGYFEGCYGPVYDFHDGNEIIGGLAIVRDVTERSIAEERQRITAERQRDLFENACDMVYSHDLAGRITAMNRAAEKITGYSRSEALRMRFIQLLAPEFQSPARRMFERQLAEGAPITQEMEIITKDARRLTLEVCSRLIFHEGKAAGVQGFARDVTERKKAERALQKANRELEERVQELQQRTREMTLLSEIGDILRACLTTEEVYSVIVKVAREVFPDQAGALYIISGTQRNIVEAVAEWGDTSKLELTFNTEECWALRRGKTHWVQDSGSGLICRHVQKPPPRGCICVPMMAQSEAVGILYLAQVKDEPMPEAKQELAIAVAEHVAMALSNIRLNETLRNQSIRDDLTGLFNRSFMEESLELELRRAIRTQHPLSIIMLSVDRFQQISEDYGVDTGNSILKSASALLLKNVRKGDIACRYGGHTFALVLPQSSFETSKNRAESLRSLARGLEMKSRNKSGHITMSIGLAVFPGHGQTVEILLRSAEAALNRATADGDCIVVAS